MKVKVLTGEEAANYLKNASKLDQIAAMETQLADAAQTITDLTSATEQLHTANTALEAQVKDLTSQVAALKAGSGVKPVRAAVAPGESGGNTELQTAIATARELMDSLN